MAAPVHLPDVVTLAVPGFVLLVLAELVIARLRHRDRYEPRDTLTSLALGLGSTIAGILTGGLFLALAITRMLTPMSVAEPAARRAS